MDSRVFIVNQHLSYSILIKEWENKKNLLKIRQKKILTNNKRNGIGIRYLIKS